VRAAGDQRDRLRAFLQGHLSAAVSVKLLFIPAVQTAAVLPVDVNALVSSDATDRKRQNTARLLGGIDAAQSPETPVSRPDAV
jgi:type IV pilus biogenesis protein CpaD/CtpE